LTIIWKTSALVSSLKTADYLTEKNYKASLYKVKEINPLLFFFQRGVIGNLKKDMIYKYNKK